MNKKWWLYIPLIFWTILIIFLSTGPGIQVPFEWGELIGADKMGHLVFYGIHTFLMAWTVHKFYGAKTKKKWLIIAFTISTLLGIVLEIIQYSFYPNRYFEILDIIANISGSLIAVIIFRKLMS